MGGKRGVLIRYEQGMKEFVAKRHYHYQNIQYVNKIFFSFFSPFTRLVLNYRNPYLAAKAVLSENMADDLKCLIRTEEEGKKIIRWILS
jgi:hypothetical protein